MLSEISQRKKNTAWSNWYVKKVEFTEGESRMVVTSGRELGKMGDVGHRVQNCSYVGWISSRDLMYSMIIIVNNIVLYTGNFLRE